MVLIATKLPFDIQLKLKTDAEIRLAEHTGLNPLRGARSDVYLIGKVLNRNKWRECEPFKPVFIIKRYIMNFV